MKIPKILVTTALVVLGSYSFGVIAAPDFHTIERARIAKKAEAQKSAEESKNCVVRKADAAPHTS